MSERPAVWTGYAVLGAALLVLVGIVALAPRGEPPEETVALRRFLSEMGLEVSEADEPPEHGTFVLLQDFRTAEESADLLSWVAEGGRLVITSASSAALGLEVETAGPASLFGEETLDPACVAAETVGVRRIVVRASALLLTAPPGSGVACFGREEGAFLLIMGHGDGTVVVMGGASPFTNELLRREDNAALAFRVMGGGPELVFGPPIPSQAALPTGDIWEVLPDPARAAVVATALAAVALALVRGRRLGPPVQEKPVAPIPASELVRATARLYRNGRALAWSGHLMREWTVSDLARRLGIPGASAADVIAQISATVALPEDAVGRILDGPDPLSDVDLIRLGGELEDLSTRAGGMTP